jgi:DNA-binding CsgD family transcriptional regulator
VGRGGQVDAAVSAREAEVLAAIGEQLSNAEIAARLFISIRTVESHVSSLLRKLGAEDRRALSLIAGERTAGTPGAAPSPTLPAALTSFVGRARERAELAAALDGQRLVSAVGPGGSARPGSRSPWPPTSPASSPTVSGTSTWSRSPTTR